MSLSREDVTTVTNFVDKISTKIGQSFSWIILLLIATMCYEIVVRYFFRSPTMWSYDSSYMMSSFVLVMGVAWVHASRSHVNVDIFYNKFPARLKASLNILFSLVLFFPTWVLVLRCMYSDVIYSWSIHEKASTGTWQPIIYPFKFWIFVGLTILVLQGLNELVKDMMAVFQKEDAA